MRVIGWSMSILRVGFLLLFALSACSNHKIDNWEEYCEQLTGVDLEEKYNRGVIFSVSFDPEAIRIDFTKKYNILVLDYIASQYLGGVTRDSKAVQEMARLKMIGAWRDGTDLHVVNSLLIRDKKLRVDEFSEFVQNYRTSIDLARVGKLDDEFQWCLFGTMNSVFDNLILHGPKGTEIVRVRLDRTLKQ